MHDPLTHVHQVNLGCQTQEVGSKRTPYANEPTLGRVTTKPFTIFYKSSSGLDLSIPRLENSCPGLDLSKAKKTDFNRVDMVSGDLQES